MRRVATSLDNGRAVLNNGAVFVATDDGAVDRVDVSSGAAVTITDLGARAFDIAATKSGVLAVGVGVESLAPEEIFLVDPRTGGTTQVVRDAGTFASDPMLAAAGDHIVAADRLHGNLLRIALDGTTTEVARVQGYLTCLAIGATRVAWLRLTSDDKAVEIRTAPLAGGEARTLDTGPPSTASCTFAGDDLYVADNEGITRYDATGNRRRITRVSDLTEPLLVVDGFVYWVERVGKRLEVRRFPVDQASP